MSEQSEPYQKLGVQLKGLRQKLQESVAEVAGAVEIDEVSLQLIEQGNERPSEDILMLLISHFGMHEDDATNLWLLAGYDKPQEKAEDSFDELVANRPIVMMMAIDTRILYSDQTNVTLNKSGVVLNFMQASAATNANAPRTPVARVGMSYEQAHELMHVLQTTLMQADTLRRPKGLPAPKTDNKPKQQKPDTN
jgi:transcriptional regulator with XRE-family HTH domain